MKLFLYIFLISLTTACCGKRTLTTDTVVRDSVNTITTIIPRDTVVIIAPDSLHMAVAIADLIKLGKKNIGTSSLQATVEIKNDSLFIDCEAAVRELQLELRDKKIEITRLRSETKTVVVPEPYIPWWAKTLSWIGGIALALFIIGTVIKTYFNK